MLEVRNLTKVYDYGTVALRNVSFNVPDGEFLVVIGLSGSGKSTLLRCINRLIDPTEGQILWDGVDITKLEGQDLRNLRRKIGMVFQQFNLVKRSTVLTNVMAGRLGYSPPGAVSPINLMKLIKNVPKPPYNAWALLTRQTSVPMNLAADSSSGLALPGH